MTDPAPEKQYKEKQCGECSLCCKLMAIPELAKPKDSWCPHVVKKRGCGIYETRPGSCRDFQCLWLLDPRLGPDWKPSKSKFVMVTGRQKEIAIHVDAQSPGAWRAEPYFSGLNAMAQAGAAHGGLVVIVERGESTVLLPGREVKLGVLADDDRLVSGWAATPSGPRLEVKVMKEADAARLVDVASRQMKP
jgi:hypothetical protein